jgi:hypothetical protein
MISIYQKYFGDDFAKLHPKIQERLSLNSEKEIQFRGEGVMKKIWRGGPHTIPALLLGKKQNILFPNTGNNVPFSIENFAYKDSYGREAVAWIRKFNFEKETTHFDATMVYSHERDKVIDYLGTHHQIIVDINMQVDDNGGFTINSGFQRFFTKNKTYRIPAFFAGNAIVSEWYDDKNNTFKIKVNVLNKYFGFLFGYEGEFQASFIDCKESEIPHYAKPIRSESRE